MTERPPLKCVVLIPALNEADSIAKVLEEIPGNLVHAIIVADNGSTDATAQRAREAGALVVYQPQRGYGSACLAAIAEAERFQPDIAVFMDADHSDYPEQLGLLLEPILQGTADLVLGSRMRGEAQRGALALQARVGNRLACFLIARFWGVRFTDLGPFRAISWSALEKLRMSDPDYGWTVEMQIKAIRQGLRIQEVSVGYRSRIGKSKITGTLLGSLGAGYKILYFIFKYGLFVR